MQHSQHLQVALLLCACCTQTAEAAATPAEAACLAASSCKIQLLLASSCCIDCRQHQAWGIRLLPADICI